MGVDVAGGDELRPRVGAFVDPEYPTVALCQVAGEDPQPLDGPALTAVGIEGMSSLIGHLREHPEHLDEFVERLAHRAEALTSAAGTSSVTTLTQAPTRPEAAVAKRRSGP